MSDGAVARPEFIEVDAPAAHVIAGEVTASPAPGPGITLAAAVLGFFVITLDAVVVNVALPSISRDFSAGITGLQWVVDGYTVMFAALLLWSGALADRVGARRAFGVGLGVFVAASVACGLAPTLPALIAARFAQGSAAAVMMPASMALLGQAYPDPRKRSGAVAAWAMGGAIASSSGPVLGGMLTLVSWRLIFLINIPVGVAALLLVARIAPSVRRRAQFDWFGQVSAVVAMGALTYGAIEAGASGFTAPRVVGSLVLAAVSAVAFVTAEGLVRHPMVPLALFRSRNVSASVAVGFAFVFGYYGLPFVMSLYLQQVRGLSALGAGLVFVPMMVAGAVLVPFSARVAERLTPRIVITAGLGVMAAGLAIVGAAPASTPVWALAALMVVVGLAGPLVIPPMTAVLLNSVPDHQAGTASGVFNTSRQLGGALAIAIFGALLSAQEGLMHGLRLSLLIAAGIAIAAGAACFCSAPPRQLRKDSPMSDVTENTEPSSAQRLLGDFAPALVGFTDDVLFGEGWKRPELSPKERSLVTVAALTTSGNTDQLVFHLDYAKQNGTSEEELIEAITHLAFYAGWPKAMAAMTVAKRVFLGDTN